MNGPIVKTGRIAGKIALVTGSARGIGAAIARKLGQHGATVIVSDVRSQAGEAVAQEIGGDSLFRQLDVRNLHDWEETIGAISERFGRLDILVNNAGGGAGGAIDSETLEQHRFIVELNLTGVWSGVRSAIPAMTAGGGGSIVNISSIDGLVGVGGLSTYTATKFAVTGMTRALAIELGSRGIRVNSVHPGIIASDLVLQSHPAVRERLDKAVARQPITRMGRPEEIADAVLFFASDESTFCTGASLVVDGGHIAGPYRDPLML